MINNNDNKTAIEFLNLALDYLKKGIEELNKKKDNEAEQQEKVTSKQEDIKLVQPVDRKAFKDIFDKVYLSKASVGKRVNQKFWEDFIPDTIKSSALRYDQIIQIIKRDNYDMYFWYVQRFTKDHRTSMNISAVNGLIIRTLIRKGIVVFDKYQKITWKEHGRDRGIYYGKDYLMNPSTNNTVINKQ